MEVSKVIESVKSVVQSLHTVAITGAILWVLVIATLQILGLVDLKVQCQWCVDLLPSFISQSLAAAGPVLRAPFEPVHITVTLLPGLGG
jgi:hypothetical protein